MKKIIITTLLAVCSINIQAQFSGQGSGTEKDPYLITNADELFEVRNDMSAYYKMVNDIDLTDWIREESPTQGWTPIGNETTPFTGSFDGDNYSIKGLIVNRPNASHVGLFGYSYGANLKNCIINNASIIGKDNVGVITGSMKGGDKPSLISNCIAIAPSVKGNENVGGIVGNLIFYTYVPKSGESFNSDISQNAIIGGTLSGSDNVGGLIGYAGGEYNYYNAGSCSISKNRIEGEITSSKQAGGIIAKGVPYSDGWRWLIITINDNLCESTIKSSSECGGIISYSSNKCININNNIYNADAIATNSVYGIANCYSSEVFSYENNFCMSDTIYSKGSTAYRVGINAKPNNYAYNGMAVFRNGKLMTIEDSNQDGTGYGLRTLKKESTYIGAGFDFTNTWTIKEGETFPYLKTQVAPVTITSFGAGNKASIKGTATEGTTVYVIVGDNMYESYILDGQWEVSLGRINVGNEAKVYAMSRGRMPSICTKAVAESGVSPVPDGKRGDANGDGVVDSADVTAIINYILGKPSSSFNKENADATDDGEILIDDAVQTVQLIMNAQ